MIVSEVRLYREGLAHVLAAQPGLEVVDDTAEDLLMRLRACRPHVVLADSAIVRATELTARSVELGARAVAFAVAEENEKEVLACAEAGVAGFVAREATMDELVAVVQTASRGGLRCSPRVASLLVRRVASLAASRSHPPENLHLTRRELEIITLIDQGLSNKGIASRLDIETATVKNHVHHLLEKLQVHRRGEAAAAIRGSLPAAGARVQLGT
jgi:DNA-binding NarL/FixJ family response regulator